MDIERQLDDLFSRIRQLEVSYRRYLAGDIPYTQPAGEKEAIERQLRSLRNVNMKRAVDRFRLSNLEARFSSYTEMFDRKVRDLEEGVETPASGVFSAKSEVDVEKGVVIEDATDRAAVEALFQGLYSKSGRSLTMDLDSFRTYLGKQISSIRTKTGCDSVQFRLVDRDGKLKLKAKPIVPTKTSDR